MLEPEQFVCQRNAMMTCVPFEVCFYSWEAERHTLSLQLLWLVLQPTCGRSLTSQSSPWPPALSLRPLPPWPVLAALFPLPSSLSSAGCTFFWRFMSASLSFPMCRTSGVIPEPPTPWAGRKWTVVTYGRRLPGAAASQQCLLLVLGLILLKKLVASVKVSSRPALAFGACAVGHRVSYLLCSLSVSLSSPI